MTNESERVSIEEEDRYHHYTGNAIPWFVRLMWLGFWVLAVVYTLRLLFPALQEELLPKI